jgi:hypothetical protein
MLGAMMKLKELSWVKEDWLQEQVEPDVLFAHMKFNIPLFTPPVTERLQKQAELFLRDSNTGEEIWHFDNGELAGYVKIKDNGIVAGITSWMH